MKKHTAHRVLPQGAALRLLSKDPFRVSFYPYLIGGQFTPMPPPSFKSHVAPKASRMSHSLQAGPPSLPGDPSRLPPAGFLVPPAQVPPGASVAAQGHDAAVLADDDTLGPAEGKRPLVATLKDLQDLLVLLARGCGLSPQPAEEAPPMTGPWPGGAILQQGLLGGR